MNLKVEKTMIKTIRIISVVLMASSLVMISGCTKKSDIKKTTENMETGEGLTQETETNENIVGENKRRMTYADASYVFHYMDIDENVEPMQYDLGSFFKEDGLMTYDDDEYTYRLGVDVSKYQKKVKWSKVEKAGFEFAMIRLGYRGYTEGDIFLDEYYEENIQNANRSGLDVGVYFFSQALTEDEAIEEAQFVLEHIKGYEIGMPIVYDPEIVYNDNSRTKGISKEQFTKNTLAFCNVIKEAGYETMVYANMRWEDEQLNMSELEGIDIWYADYVGLPQTPYHFEMWQYTEKGRVDGIDGGTDINIQMIKK